MYGKKTPKGEAIDKTPYSSYYPHNIDISERKWRDDYRQFISVDPARKNLGFRIERRHDPNGPFKGLIETLAYAKISIEEILETDTTVYNKTYDNLTNFLDKHKEYFDETHYVIIERQVVENYKAIRISQHVISYFSIVLHNKKLLPSIIEVAPQLKGKMLSVPKGVHNKELKKWAVDKATEILIKRKDEYALDIFEQLKKGKHKLDDVSDTLLQIEAIILFWKQNNLEKEAYTYVKKINIIMKPTPSTDGLDSGLDDGLDDGNDTNQESNPDLLPDSPTPQSPTATVKSQAPSATVKPQATEKPTAPSAPDTTVKRKIIIRKK
jgi:hypothetical protein